MSHSTIMHIWPGERIEYGEKLHNSYGCAPIIWDKLCQRYCGTKPFSYISDHALDRLWLCYHDLSIPLSHRAVLGMTFDTSYVAQNDFMQAAEHIKEFLCEFPVVGTSVNHWPRIAALFESHPDIPGIGIYQTSVSENPYMEWDEEHEEERPKWNDIYSIYDDLRDTIP